MATVGGSDLGVRIVESGWLETAQPVLEPNLLTGSQTFDAVVEGGRFAGLACARRLAELRPDDRIALVEANRIGRALSGRNSGFLLDSSMSLRSPDQDIMVPNRLQATGFATLRDLVARYQIDCDWNEIGYLRTATSNYELGVLDRVRALLTKLGTKFDELTSNQLQGITGSTRFLAGLVNGRTALVQPVKLVRGLAETLPENVSVFEMSWVSHISTRSGRHRLVCTDGEISCRAIFLCYNHGFPEFGFGRFRQVEIANFAAVTPPLQDHHGEVASVPEVGILPIILSVPTIRKTPDNGLLIRAYLAFTPGRAATPDEYREQSHLARQTMIMRWRHLADSPFEFTWHGVTPITRNGARFFGQIGKNCYATAFCSGAGVTSGTSAGAALANLGSEQNTQDLRDFQSMPAPSFVPPGWLLQFFVERGMKKSEREWHKAYAEPESRIEGA